MLEYKQKRNNGRTPFAGVYKFVCVCGWVGGGGEICTSIFQNVGDKSYRVTKHTNWLSTKKLRLAKLGYQSNCRIMYISNAEGVIGT